MLQARFKCTVLTPMFLGGIAPNETAEIRVPSIRGAMRWWYRALLAGRGHSLPALREEEARIFGSTERASSVRMRVANKRPNIQSHKKISKLGDRNSGTNYLWYFVKAGDNERYFIAPRSTFQLVFTAFPEEGEAIEEAARALWLLSFLGGLGTRSRRMAGAFTVSVSSSSDALSLPTFTPSRGFDDWFRKELQRIVPSDTSPDPELSRKGIPVLHSHYAQIRRLSSEKSWTHAVEKTGQQYKGYRGERSVKTQKKIHLGLPLADGRQGKKTVTVKSDGETLERRASPIWLQSAKFASGNVAALMTAFNSALAPPEVTVRARGNRAETNPYAVASDFFDHIEARPSYLE